MNYKIFLNYAVVVLLSIWPVAIFHFLNESYPQADSAEYLKLSLRLYNSILDLNFTEAWENFFNVRLWKPTFTGYWSLPFLILTSGKLKLSAVLTMLSFQSLSVVFIYKTIRLFQSNGWAIALTISYSMMVFFQSNFQFYMGEMALVMSSLGILFFTINLEFKTTYKDIIGVILMMGIAFLSRPIEAIFSVGPLFLYGLFLLFKRKNLDLGSFLFFLIISFGSILIGGYYFFQVINGDLLPLVFNGIQLHLIIYIPAVIFVMWSLIEYWRIRTLTPLIVSSITMILVFWYVPFFLGLVNWVHQCTFGDLAQRTGGRNNLNFWSFSQLIFNKLDLKFTFFLFLIPLVGNCRFLLTNLLKINAITITVFFSLLLFIIGASTQNGDIRYYYANLAVMLVVITYFLNLKNKLVVYLLAFWISVTVGFQSFNHFLVLKKNEEIHLQANKISFHSIFKGNPHQILSQLIPELMLDQKVKDARHLKTRIMILVKDFPSLTGEYASMFDPWSLQLAAYEYGANNIVVQHEGSFHVQDQLTYLKDLICRYNWIILGPKEGKASPVWDLGGVLADVVLNSYNRDDMRDSLKLLKSFEYKFNGVSLSFPLFKIEDKTFCK